MSSLSVSGGLDCLVERNAYGSQIASFTAPISTIYGSSHDGIFIRAPKITHLGSTKAIAWLEERPDQIVAIEHGNLIGTTFHPELSESLHWHHRLVMKL